MESNFEWITANGDIGIRFFHSIDDGGYSNPPHWHNDLEIIYLLEGRLKVRFGDGGERGCAADRVTSEGGAVRSHGERLGHLFGGADGADRHTAAHGLGHGDDIGLDAIVHVGHERAGTTLTGLPFIEQ